MVMNILFTVLTNSAIYIIVVDFPKSAVFQGHCHIFNSKRSAFFFFFSVLLTYIFCHKSTRFPLF